MYSHIPRGKNRGFFVRKGFLLVGGPARLNLTVVERKHWKWLAAIWAWLLMSASGQTISGTSLNAKNPLPRAAIIDNADFESRFPEASKRITSVIEKLAATHGYRIYLVLEPVLIGTTAPELANELRLEWLKDSDGMVIVFEIDGRNVGIGQDTVGQVYEADAVNRIPSHETAAILSRTIAAVKADRTSDVFLEDLITQLSASIDDYFTRRNTPPPHERSVKIALLVVGALAVLGLIAIGIGGLAHHSNREKARSYSFPEVDVPERLGAPSGAAVVSRPFRRNPGA